ncbi:MAG: class I SAM-dependent methyltransferase [Acidimicrobiales bacterium]
MGSFETGQQLWIERLGNLRNTIRQELITRQLAHHVRPGMSVLDVGCGQGTQALRLAERGCRVTGVDVSPELLARFAGDADRAGLSVELIEGTLDELGELVDGRRFDVVCAHGVLMYLDDRAGAIARLAARSAEPDGRLSITFRNAESLAVRPGFRRDWAGALAALDTDTYVIELGVTVRADRLGDVINELSAVGLAVVVWYGIRVFNDAVDSELAVPDDEDMSLLIEAEDQAGRRDPYRSMASQIHVIAART